MIQMMQPGEEILRPVELENSSEFRHALESAIWIDLVRPESPEEQMVQEVLGLEIPTPEEMHEISESSRLFAEKDGLYASTWVLNYESVIPVNTSVTMISNAKRLVTIRYADHHAFRIFSSARNRLQRRRFNSAAIVYIELLEAMVGHISSTLRLIEQDLNSLSLRIFSEQNKHKKAQPTIKLKSIVQRLGKRNSLVASLRESSVSLSTLIPFIVENSKDWMLDDIRTRLITLERDILSLREYDSQLASEISFLLDSTVGLISIDQNQSMKILSIAAVILALI